MAEVWRQLTPAMAVYGAGRELALSESLLQNVQHPALWWYSAHVPALILGTAQKPAILDNTACSEQNLEIYKRASGGALVLAEPSFLSLDVALPPEHPLAPTDVVETYHWLGEVWLESLSKLGLVGARLAKVTEVREQRTARDSEIEQEREDYRLANLICFGTLSPYEVVSEEGLKLVGLSQIRRRVGTLLQCGLPLQKQSGRLVESLALETSEKTRLAQLLDTRMTALEFDVDERKFKPEEILSAFEETLAQKHNIILTESVWTEAELAQAHELETGKYQRLM
ncbi:hypothetical protein [Candidatus Chlorohelix sp.]|uniref:lipoyl protein ligase domain-containing protein n=1 Tax=Candidatus Chlorohelix sp. TaxID=3139201 RepID=UPI003027E201